VVAAAAVSLSIGAVGAGAASGQRPAGSTALPAASTRQMVTLVTGDHVVVDHRSGGRTEETFLPAAGHSRAYQAMTLDGQSYVVPRDAVAGMGSRWVLGDFDVTRLAEGRTAPSVRPDVAHRSGGYTDVLADAARSHAAGGYHLEVLTLNGIGPSGHPSDAGSIILVNLENTELYTAFLFFDGKPIKLQVPAGQYAAVGGFFPSGANGDVATVVVPQVAVEHDTTLTVDARTATDPVLLSLPVPTTIQTATFTVQLDAKRGSFTDSSSVGSGLGLTVNPASSPSIGSLSSSAQWQNIAKSGGATYNVLFNSKGIPKDEDFSAGPSNLAAVDTTYASDGPTRYGDEAVFAFTPSDPFAFSGGYPLVRPLARMEYYSTGTGVAWSRSIDTTNPFSQTDVEFSDNLQSYVPGTTDDNWLSPPLGPAVPVAPSGVAPAFSTFACAVCRSTGRLDLDFVPWGDGTPGHLGFASGLEHSSFSLYRGPDLVASGAVPEGSYAIPAAPAVYRLTFHDQRSTPTWRTSTSTTTAWSFASAAAAPDLPPHWICLDGSRDCSTLSLLIPRYTLPTNHRSQEYPGATGLTLGFSDDDEAGSVSVDDVHASVSFDGGHSWTVATVRHETGDSVLVSYVNPAPAAAGTYASLKVSAEDGNGGTVTQTVIDAYAVVRSA
jgi:hypothetical protein